MKSISVPHLYTGNAWAGRKIGLFGGSFNPAHEGHLHASLMALRTMGLDQVWWLVSPQNPLKSARDMAPFEERLRDARNFVRHPRIIVTGLEAELGTRFTSDTLRLLHKRFPRTSFVWIMGADNLANFHRWQKWETIFRTTPVAIYDRPPYSLKVTVSRAARKFKSSRQKGRSGKGLVETNPPAWAFFHTPLKDISATAIRAGRQGRTS